MVAESKVSDKYQVVIPKQIRKSLGVRRGIKLIWTTVLPEGVFVKPAHTKPNESNRLYWARRMRGLGKEIWRGEDAVKYVRRLRNEWARSEKRRGIV